MEICENKLFKGVHEILLEPHRDERGFFMRAYDEDIFQKSGLHCHWLQENHSRSEKKGILRGLHFQFPPFSESKLVRCIRGAILDVFVDLRKGSPSFGKWGSLKLAADAHNMLFIPRGFAHGFCTLTDDSEVLYKVDSPYESRFESGLLWSDPDLAIAWPVERPLLSEKDAKNQTFKEFIAEHKFIDLKDQK